MTDETANLILEHPKAIRSKIDSIALDVADPKSRIQTLESHMAMMVSAMAPHILRLDRVGERVARIGWRLELIV